jgi:hypothetical protein
MTLSTFANDFACSAAPGQSNYNAPYYTDQSNYNAPYYTGQSNFNAPYSTGLMNNLHTPYCAGNLDDNNRSSHPDSMNKSNTLNSAGTSNNQAMSNNGSPMPR